MADLLVKFDPEIEFDPIVDILYAPPTEVQSEDGIINRTVDQTKLTGVFAPLIRVNNQNINWSAVMSFELGTKLSVPYLNVTINDFMNICKTFDQPGADNILRLQILPQHDNTYKKINMNFYITDYQTPRNETLSLTCIYMAPNLWNSELKSYGKISTYKFYETLAHECKLGFVSNISDTDDARYIYASNKSPRDMIPKVFLEGGSEKIILDAWIDWRNNLVLADMYDRWNTIENDIKYWTGMRMLNVEPNGPQQPEEIERIITNALPYRYRETYTNEYKIVNNTSKNSLLGTDKVVTSYSFDELESDDLLIEDGDIKNDIFKKFIYAGEYVGDYNYLKQMYCREAYMQKINSTMIKVTLDTPVMGLMKGEKVNVLWFDMNNFVASSTNEADSGMNTNIPTLSDNTAYQDEYMLNKQVSGQYLIVEETLKFDNWSGSPMWHLDLLLSRPSDQIFNYADALKAMNESSEQKQE